MSRQAGTDRGMDKRVWRELETVADEEVKRLIRELPPAVRSQVSDIPIVFEKVPARDLVRDGLDPDLLGLFVGDPFPEPGRDPIPAEILLFLLNLWDEAAGDEAEYRKQVRITLLHEIGHFLGLDEDGLIARDLE